MIIAIRRFDTCDVDNVFMVFEKKFAYQHLNNVILNLPNSLLSTSLDAIEVLTVKAAPWKISMIGTEIIENITVGILKICILVRRS